MDDSLKPRRPRSEEQAEIDEFIAGQEAREEARFLRELERPPGEALLLESERIAMEEEAELSEMKRWETSDERAESERILRVEAEIAIERPLLRERELIRTFGSLRQAATATSLA